MPDESQEYEYSGEMQEPQTELQEMKDGWTRSRTHTVGAVAMWSVYIIAGLTSFGFGYKYVVPFSTGEQLLGMNVARLIGGIVSLVSTDVMARVWNSVRVKGITSKSQGDTAAAGFYICFGSSIIMSLIFCLSVIFEWRGADTSNSSTVTAGQLLVTIMIVVLTCLWAWFEVSSPDFTTAKIQAESRNRVTDARLNILARVAKRAGQQLEADMRGEEAGMVRDIANASRQQLREQLGYVSRDGSQQALPQPAAMVPARDMSRRDGESYTVTLDYLNGYYAGDDDFFGQAGES